ncbi:hypothetical protein LZ639_17975 [Pseudomonas stutzeri]|uniref:hypothetical protein n=1 Tax=Stutzerimonas stutzeri TaxID=316 RepID=UPI001F30DA17|nr:hypothetical protein [Stutzerimonas stutzeri]MCF0017218.1 hypothetical protein [Stutzerimonas stutzeri]MCF0021752.1 hypothetical protein [Stutzerimonas stutzeri]MDH0101862.1 hypothetical protein [Stutzerimonas stutzeri]MDH1589437.1 hypothetical protein [Stutzerimonas stutzeri]
MTMLLKTYETQNLLCNVSVNGATTTPDTYAFRGDLVLEEGEIADASGRRPPWSSRRSCSSSRGNWR